LRLLGGLPTLPGGLQGRSVPTNITQGMYKNMKHLATNMLSLDVFDKATFNKVIILTNQNET
jgi:hypothetical protein